MNKNLHQANSSFCESNLSVASYEKDESTLSTLTLAAPRSTANLAGGNTRKATISTFIFFFLLLVPAVSTWEFNELPPTLMVNRKLWSMSPKQSSLSEFKTHCVKLDRLQIEGEKLGKNKGIPDLETESSPVDQKSENYVEAEKKEDHKKWSFRSITTFGVLIAAIIYPLFIYRRRNLVPNRLN